MISVFKTKSIISSFLTIRLLVSLVGITVLSGCNKDEGNSLTVTPDQITFNSEGGTSNISINTDAPSWEITNAASDWLTISHPSGTLPSATVKLTVTTRSLQARTGQLTITAGDASPVIVNVSQSASDHLYSITTDVPTLDFKSAGETKPLKITTDAEAWNLTTGADWLQFSHTSGNKGSASINVTASSNPTDDARTAVITLTADNAATLEFTITQEAPLYPNYNTSPTEPDATGMSSNAVQIASKITIGWNLGNTLEAIGGETNWGNPKATKALIDFVKSKGFNAVRLPCSWNQYADSETAKISDEWLDRVKEVVQYCVDNDMYVLLNIHWDQGWLDENINIESQEETAAKQKAFWQQIATHLRDFDEHLMFASANEPPVENATQMSILNSYHQTFINAVRSTGGKNSYRVLVVQGPSTDIVKTNTLMTSLPVDEVSDRLMVEVHYYNPWQFAGLTEDASWGDMVYYWGEGYHSETDPSRNASWGEESEVDTQFALMKTKFVDQGIPVILGEYGAIRRTSLTGDNLSLHLASRAHYTKYITMVAIENGMLPFYWDEGALGNNSFGFIDRSNNTVFDEQVLNAIIQGAGQ